jgi:soluble lytic murein transglycosylase-like protein
MRQLVRVAVVPLWLCLAGSCVAKTMTVREYSARWVHYYADVYRVPEELVQAVIETESNWNPLAVSQKGAEGLMQLEAPTAARFGVKDRFAIPDNVSGGVAYLAYLIRLFHGDLRLVLAAYLAGESRILSRGLQYSSREVYLYVNRVLGIYIAIRARHPASE